MPISKAELKKLASLKTKKGRSSENRFLAEGVRVLEEALKFNFLPIKLLCVQAGISERGKNLIKQIKSKRIEVSEVSAREMEAISDTETAQGIAAVFNLPESRLSKLYKPSYRRVLLCDRINDPGNLGTLVRTALAFEFEMMLITDKTVELFNPKAVRASAGAIFGLPTTKATFEELKEFKKSSNAKIAAAVVQHGIREKINEVSEIDLKEKSPVVLAIGSEADGLSEEILSMSDFKMTIRHSSKVESLNAAVAGAILMHDIYEKQWTKSGE